MKKSFRHAAQFVLILIFLFSSIAAAPISETQIAAKTRMDQFLEEHGGYACSEESYFTCVTLEVPLDHFNPDDTRAIEVTFAVLPAARPASRKGMFVVATGGPGTSGVLSADYYVAAYDQKIFNRFDIVFFDQRGMGLSGGLACPAAAATYYQQDATGSSDPDAAIKQFANTFSADCVNELSNPELLPYLGTAQAIEDLEYFRQLVGDDTFWLYGESYGTQYVQTYAAKYGDRLKGLILDGTVDLTLTGWEYYAQQAQAFNETMVATLASCEDDPLCIQDVTSRFTFDPNHLEQRALWVYDFLALHLKKAPVNFYHPLPEGGFEEREFTLTDLETVAASQMYGESDRMMFLRALTSGASDLDIVPLARLLYLSLGLDPQTLEVIPDPSYSDAIFYGVECQDYGYPGNSPEEKADNYLQAGDSFSIPRFESVFYGDLPCAYWQSANSDPTRPEPFLAEGIPTLVLGATADPATPVGNGISVYERLTDGYLITTEGGPHVTFGYGNECPDVLVTNFLVNGKVPTQRETNCEGILTDSYVPLAPRDASSFATALDAFTSIETEISYLPEYYYWDGFEPASAGCPFGGTIGFESTDTGYDYTLTDCAFSKGFALTGIGSYHPGKDRFTLSVTTTGYWACGLSTYARTGAKIKLTGNCNNLSIKKQTKWSLFKYWKKWKLQHPLWSRARHNPHR